MPTQQKLRGGYYTPEPIARFLIEWALNGADKPTQILEPSMGDGAFVVPTIKYMQDRGLNHDAITSSITGIELFNEELKIAKTRIDQLDIKSDDINLISGDFFNAIVKDFPDKKFDVILGNPPFIRYQNFPEAQRDEAMKQLNDAGFKLNKLTNAWLFFLLRSITLMAEKSKLAMVIPAELLQVSYASSARVFLSEHFNSVTVITFKTLVFDGIQQEVVLLLAEKDPEKHFSGIDVIEIEDASELQNYKHAIKGPEHLKPIDHISDKWIQYFLSKEEILLLRSLENNEKLTKLGELVSVDVGIVTGNNKFFVLNESQVEEHNIREYTIPLVGKSASLIGLAFDKSAWLDAVEAQVPSHLLSLNNDSSLTPELDKYIKLGEDLEVNLGYKCRIRKKWFVVPSVNVPDAFMLRQIHGYPKLIVNEAGAACTDTIHRIRLKQPKQAKSFSVSFVNSLSFAVSEVVGRSYGGGVLELEPTEAENILLPYDKNTADKLNFALVDGYLRENNVEAALDYVDNKLLIEYMGLSPSEVYALKGIWKKLSGRRLKRK